jgi:hypothetical protein
MSLFLPFQRATLLIPSASVSDPNRKHLFILLTNPHPHPESNIKSSLLVSVSTMYPRLPFDPACKLFAGDHPFIKHDSYVVYRTARIETADKLINGVSQGIFNHKETLSGEIFARVCHGLTTSDFTAPTILRFYEAATTKL